jgi:hypothetical protein
MCPFNGERRCSVGAASRTASRSCCHCPVHASPQYTARRISEDMTLSQFLSSQFPVWVFSAAQEHMDQQYTASGCHQAHMQRSFTVAEPVKQQQLNSLGYDFVCGLLRHSPPQHTQNTHPSRYAAPMYAHQMKHADNVMYIVLLI